MPLNIASAADAKGGKLGGGGGGQGGGGDEKRNKKAKHIQHPVSSAVAKLFFLREALNFAAGR